MVVYENHDVTMRVARVGQPAGNVSWLWIGNAWIVADDRLGVVVLGNLNSTRGIRLTNHVAASFGEYLALQGKFLGGINNLLC